MDARPDDDAGADDTTGAQDLPDTPGPPADDRGRTPGGDVRPSSADDEVWASLVARLADVPTDVDPSPRAGRVLRRAPHEDAPTEPSADAPAPPPTPVGRDWDGTSQYDEAEDAVDDLEHFVPQDPGPVLGGDPLLTLAWVAVAGVPLFMLVVVVAWQDAPTLLVRAAAGLFVVAVAVLVWRMPQRREPSDDDGAVV